MGGGGMDVQLAEFAPEGELLFRGDALVAEEDHEMLGERTVDLVELAVGARCAGDQFADVDAGDFSADDRRQLFDADGLVGLVLARGVAIERA